MGDIFSAPHCFDMPAHPLAELFPMLPEQEIRELADDRADGSRAAANGGAPSELIAYGADDRDILAAAPIDGAFVPLRLPLSIIVPALSTSWREALEGWFAGRDGPVTLTELYRAFADHPKARGNQHWREKLRQVLQRGQFERVDKGLWRAPAA